MRVTPAVSWGTLPMSREGMMCARRRNLGKGADSAMGTHPTPTPTWGVTVPVAILTALSRAIAGWTAAVYPGTLAHLEAASRDPTARRPNTWHALARLSNGMRLRFTLVVLHDGVACVTRHARLAGGEADAAVLRPPVASRPSRR